MKLGNKAAFVPAILLLGCSVAAAPQRENIVQESLENIEIPQSWRTQSTAEPLQKSWLASFNDKALESIVAEALRGSLDLRGAKARLDKAQATATSAGASLTPTVQIGAAASEQGTSLSDSYGTRGAGLSVSWEADVWGRLRSQRDAAKESYEGAVNDYEFAKLSLVAATSKAWFLATETNRQVALATKIVETYSEMLRVLDARVKAGKPAQQDFLLTRAEQSAAKERLQTASTAQEQASRALELLLGRYPSAEVKTANTLATQPPSVPSGLPSQLLERRPDLLAAERRVRAAFKNVEAKKLAKLPRIVLSADTGVASGLSGLTAGKAFFNVASNFFMPIYDGGQLQSQVDIATAEQEEALVAYGQAALKAFNEVENKLSLGGALLVQEQLLRSEVNDLMNALRIRKLEEKSGKADILSVLQLQTKVNQAKSNLISVLAAQRAERVNLHLALGGSF